MYQNEECINVIITYIEEKIKGGYEPVFTINEFVDYLRFYYRAKGICYGTKTEINRGFVLSCLKNLDFVLKRGENPQNYFISYAIDSRFGLSSPWDCLVAKQFLEGTPKRGFNKFYSDQQYELGKYVAVSFLPTIWDGYLSDVSFNLNLQNGYYLPELLENTDYKELDKMRRDSLDYMQTVAERIACCCYRDRRFQMTSKEDCLYAHANFNAVMQGYEDLLELARNYLGKVDFSFNYQNGLITIEKNIPIWEETTEGLVSKPHKLIEEKAAVNKNNQRLVRALEKGI